MAAHRIITANRSLTMVSEIHTHAAEIKSDVPAGFNTQADISETPRMFQAQVALITKNPGDDTGTFYKRLLKLMIFDGTCHLSSLSIIAAMMQCSNERFYDQLRIILGHSGCIVATMTLQEFMDLHPELEAADVDDITVYDGMEASHFVLSLSLVMNIIGKRLTNANYTAWCTSREKSYSAPLGLRTSDPLLKFLEPSLAFSTSMYEDIKIFPDVRRYFFMNIYGLSQKSNLLGASLLKGAELTNWTFIRYWLIQLNPDLLMWNELAKYLPQLCAAYAKFQRLGELAEWCKLILAPEDLREFHSLELDVPFEVAKAIATQYGKTST